MLCKLLIASRVCGDAPAIVHFVDYFAFWGHTPRRRVSMDAQHRTCPLPQPYAARLWTARTERVNVARMRDKRAMVHMIICDYDYIVYCIYTIHTIL